MRFATKASPARSTGGRFTSTRTTRRRSVGTHRTVRWRAKRSRVSSASRSFRGCGTTRSRTSSRPCSRWQDSMHADLEEKRGLAANEPAARAPSQDPVPAPVQRPFWTLLPARRLQFTLDVSVLSCAFVFSYLLRFDFSLPEDIRVVAIKQLPVV